MVDFEITCVLIVTLCHMYKIHVLGLKFLHDFNELGFSKLKDQKIMITKNVTSRILM